MSDSSTSSSSSLSSSTHSNASSPPTTAVDAPDGLGALPVIGSPNAIASARQAAQARLVRFEDQCVLIPPSSLLASAGRDRSLIFATKSYALPISPLPWRKSRARNRASIGGGIIEGLTQWEEVQREQSSSSASTPSPIGSSANASASQLDLTRGRERIVVKVPYPVFRRKSRSQSVSPVRYSLRENSVPPPSPLRSCLVHHHEVESHGIENPLKVVLTSSTPPSAFAPIFNKYAGASPPGITRRAREQLTRSSCPAPLREDVETIPLRACCPQCLPACEFEWARQAAIAAAPVSLKNSRRVSAPPLGRTPGSGYRTKANDIATEKARFLNAIKNPNEESHSSDETEDWCSGMHFTKGALRRRRAAGNAAGFALLRSVVKVDEVAGKKKDAKSESLKKTAMGQDNKAGSESEADEMFWTPTASPNNSSSNLPVHICPPDEEELGVLEAATFAQLKRGDRAKPKAVRVSRRERERLMESQVIAFDPSLPDPDALPADLMEVPVRPIPPPAPSRSLSSLLPIQPRPGSGGSKVETTSNETSPTIMAAPPASSAQKRRRRASLTVNAASFVRASVGVLRGLSMGGPAGQNNYGYSAAVVV